MTITLEEFLLRSLCPDAERLRKQAADLAERLIAQPPRAGVTSLNHVGRNSSADDLAVTDAR